MLNTNRGAARHHGLICPRCNTVFGTSYYFWDTSKCKHSIQFYLKKIKKKNPEHYEYFMKEEENTRRRYHYDLENN